MIPVLYLPNAADFSTFGLGVLTDTISCEVTEERNGVFECLLKYPVSGQHYGLITKECIIKAKPNDTRSFQRKPHLSAAFITSTLPVTAIRLLPNG